MNQLEMQIQDYHDSIQRILGMLPSKKRQKAARGLKTLGKLMQDLATGTSSSDIEARFAKIRSQLDPILDDVGEVEPLAVTREAPIEDRAATPTADLDRWRCAHLPPAFTEDETAQGDALRLVDDHE